MAKTQASRPSKRKDFHKRHDAKHADMKAFESAFACQDYPRALEVAQRLVQRYPSSPQVHELHANALGRLDRLEEAVEAMQKAVDLCEGSNTGQRLKLGQYQILAGNAALAVDVLEGVVQEAPEHVMALAWLSRAYHQLGQNSRGLEINDRVISLDECHEEALLWRSRILDQLGQHDEALEVLTKLLQLNPRRAGVHNHLAALLVKEAEYEEAEEHYYEEFQLDTSNGKALSNLWMTSHYNPAYDGSALFQMAVEWDKQFGERSSRVRASTVQDASKRLRIGLLSGGFRMHPVGQMILPALQNLPSDQFELVFYSTNQYIDTLTQKIQVLAHSWQPIEGLSDGQLDQKIREDEIDILIDLNGAGEGSRYRTLTREPAPLIVKWVGGLVNTTGLESVDYLISDHIETPEGVDEYYVEKLIRLPNDYICYQVPEYAPDCNGLPALTNGYITFGCLNNPAKLSAPLLEEWATLLKEVPGSKLLLRGIQFESERFRNKIIMAFNNQGVGEERLLMEGPAQHQEFLETYQRIDIALDTWPYSGGLTTCEALLMGVPVVTKTGPTFAGRHSATHLVNAGLSELVTDSWEDFRVRAKELANDLPNLAYIRAALRTILLDSPICDGPRFAKHLTTALRAIWQRHCEGKAPAALAFEQGGRAGFEGEHEPLRFEPLRDEAAFDWRLESPVVVLDNGGNLAAKPASEQLLRSGDMAMLVFDPADRLEMAGHLSHYGEFQCYSGVVLGDGQPLTLYSGEDSDFFTTLHPLLESPIGSGEQMVPSIALDTIEGLAGIDMLSLDDCHDSLAILESGTRALKNTLLIQARVRFNPRFAKEPDVGRLVQWANHHGFRFYRFHNEQYQGIGQEGDDAAHEHSQLISADALFVPSNERMNRLKDDQKVKLAFLLDNLYGIRDLPEALLKSLPLSEGYRTRNAALRGTPQGDAVLPESGGRQTSETERNAWKQVALGMLSANLPMDRKPHGLPGSLVVSLTSYPKRFETLPLTLKSLLSQTVVPDRVVLWIAHEDKEQITPEMQSLMRQGLEIRFCEEWKSFNKIVHSVKAFPEAFVATADDDIYYYPTWLEELVVRYQPGEKAIPAHRLHRIVLDGEGAPVSYKDWSWNYRESLAGHDLNFPTGVGGVLYPPGCFHEDFTDYRIIKEICPNQDDVWVYFMARLAGYSFKPTGSPMRLVNWPSSQEVSLFSYNIAGGNDEQFGRALKKYGRVYQASSGTGEDVGQLKPSALGLRFCAETPQYIVHNLNNWDEYDVVDRFIRIFQHEGVARFVDVGANVGIFSMLSLKYGLSTLAVEASPSTAGVLERNLEINSGSGADYRVDQVAVSDSHGTISFYRKSVADPGASIYQDIERRGQTLSVSNHEQAIAVPFMERLIDWEVNDGDFIKVDVEGAELLFLEEALETLRGDAVLPSFYIQLHLMNYAVNETSKDAIRIMKADAVVGQVSLEDYHVWLRPCQDTWIKVDKDMHDTYWKAVEIRQASGAEYPERFNVDILMLSKAKFEVDPFD